MVMSSEVKITFNRLNYTHDGEYLCRNGYPYEADLIEYLPAFYKNGNPKRGPNRARQKKSQGFWAAQCAFRGLPVNGTITEIQSRLRNGPQVMVPELVKIENKLTAEVKEKRRLAKEEKQRKAEIARQKEESEATRDLIRRFHKSENSPKAILLKAWRSGMPAAARELAIPYEIIRTSMDLSSDWIIIGITQSHVDTQVSRIREEEKIFNAAQAKIWAEREAVEDARRVEEERVRLEAFAKETAAIAKQSEKDGMWDVAGEYLATCAKLDDFSSRYDKLILTVYRIDAGSKSQMFGKFDFGVVNGWFRFENPTGKTRTPSTAEKIAKIGKKRKRDSWDVGENDDGDDGEEKDDEEGLYHYGTDGDADEPNGVYLLNAENRPSSKQPIWQYRWRGRNSGEGEIQTDADKVLESVTFSGRGGAEMTGTFRWDYIIGECKFTAVKVKMGNPKEASKIEIDLEWERLTERAHDREGSRRWGR
ncbi:hypothetical protein EJ08DRAFT_77515 [Tothia fuscella]|uniref:Uncharacterized protein n=1 Tax=Tothia fuscella TaxID=1048955 RepID=A0A9P4NXF1_9PEZI|nr:hypothetical protein EJ08DRAFT_77515 [Tothia fuscella]